MSSIIESVIKQFKNDECVGESLEDCGGNIIGSQAGDYSVVYPSFLSSKQLLASGGSIVKIDVSNFNISISNSIISSVQKDIKNLDKLKITNTYGKNQLSDLDTLVSIRKSVNSSLLASKHIKRIDEKDRSKKMPDIFLSILFGDKSSLKLDSFNSNVIKICDFKFIPIETLSSIAQKLTNLNPAVIGISGKTVSELSAAVLIEEQAINLVAEFFPIFNIPEDNIIRKNGSHISGGYYTFYKNNIYIKMPDISGKDSAGFGSDIYTDDSNLFFEIIFNGSLTRIDIDDFVPPVCATIFEEPDSLPVDNEPFEVIIETTANIEDIKCGYLSLLHIGNNSEKDSGVNVYSNGGEIFSIPLLANTGSVSHNLTDLQKSKLSKYFNADLSGLKYVPYLGSELSLICGEMNRPDIALADREESTSNSKNDRKYYSPNSQAAIKSLVSVKPRIYNDQEIPVTWIKSIGAPISEGDGLIKITFSSSEIRSVINVSQIPEIKFALYIADNDFQISRIPGRNIELFLPSPYISSVSPNGFSGSDRLLVTDSNLNFVIEGESFGAVTQITFTNESGTSFSFYSLNSHITIDENKVALFLPNQLSSYGFVLDTEYAVSLVDGNGNTSQNKSIYISEDSSTSLPENSSDAVTFINNEFKSIGFGSYIYGVPLSFGQESAKIRIRSKSRVFTKDAEIYAYLAVPSGYGKQISAPDHILTLSNPSFAPTKSIEILSDIEYKFGPSLTGDFYRIGNGTAVLKFPGKFYARNYSSLLDLDEAYIVFTNRRIVEFGSGNIQINDESIYSYLQIGSKTDKKPAFTNGPIVIGLAAEMSGSSGVIHTFKNNMPTEIAELFQATTSSYGKISAFKKIDKLAVVFAGSPESNIKKRYSFNLGSEDITSKLSHTIRPTLDGKYLYSIFENISTSQEGPLSFYIKKKDKIFNMNLDSKEINKQLSVYFPNTFFYSIDEETGVLSTSSLTSSTITNTDGDSGMITYSEVVDKINVILNEINSGIGIDFSLNTDSALTLFSPITLLSNFKTIIDADTGNGIEPLTINPFVSTNDIFSISKLALSIPSGAEFSSYSKDKYGQILAFGTITIENPITISFNSPEVISVNKTNFQVGDKIKVKVRNSKKDFIIMVNDEPLNPISSPMAITTDGEGVYEGEFIITNKVKPILDAAGLNCFTICASSTNDERNRSKLSLGGDFVIDLENQMDNLLYGPLKNSLPDVEELKDKLRQFSLRLASIKLSDASVPTELINSFCDYSFHLTADLKIALNGFQTLMTPIQIIFCIIDVICSLLNPVKISKAVIRLFECLYDLILLLPQISVPVMFLQLILHLLEVLKCVIDKVLLTMTAINNIIKALEAMVKAKNWQSIVALEQVLSEYLFEIEIQLQVLDPITSILSIFLELMQLAFRFPCNVTPGSDPSCGLDGTLLAGIVGGIIAPDEEILPNALIPVAQPYTLQSVEAAAASSDGSAPLTEPTVGDVIATRGSTNYIESMAVDANSLRATNSSLDFMATFAPTITKSRKGFGNPAIVKFQFNSRGENGFFSRKKVFDPTQTLDAALKLIDISGGELKIASGKGNFYSPIDGAKFITINGDGEGTVDPLVLTFNIPSYTVTESGELEQTGSQTITRTFDDIPKMAIMDEEFNLYFIEPDGIEFDNDDNVKSIKAKMMNNITAPKLKFAKEDEEVDINNDDEIDADEIVNVFDFPQIYFVDMRQAHDQIQQVCYTASINNFVLENDSDEIENIIEISKECLDVFLSQTKTLISDARASMQRGEIPSVIDQDKFQGFSDTLNGCLEESVDDICRYVVNTLNTSTLVNGDTDLSPLSSFPDLELTSDVLESFESGTPALTGAREYASGSGDSAEVRVGDDAIITIIPRDSYDEEISADFRQKIKIDIISDETGTATIVENADGSVVTKSSNTYSAKITATTAGIVQIRIKICDRTMQAITYGGIEEDETDDSLVDCVDDATPAEESASTSLGALIKIDRVLTIFFVNKASAVLSQANNGAEQAKPEPQEFGTGLEN